MLDSVLKKYCLKLKITVKSAVSALMVALAVALPQIAHAAGGASAGAAWLPMYAPALLAGCLLGWQWGLGVGILAPLASFAFTSLALGNAMPVLERLPYMTCELAVFGLVSGLFSKKIQKNVLFAFPAVAAAQLSGRAVYAVYNLIAGKSLSAIWAAVQTGLTGLYAQLVIVPLVVVVLAKALIRERKENERP